MSLEEKKILWEKVMGIRTHDGVIEDLFEEGKPWALSVFLLTYA